MDELISRSLGPLIRSRRHARALTLESLAKLVGCTKSYLSGIENEKRDNAPSHKLLHKLENALGFECGELIEIAMWRATPAGVRKQLTELRHQAQATQRLVAILARATSTPEQHASKRQNSKTAQNSKTTNRLQGEDPELDSDLSPDAILPPDRWRSLDDLHRSGQLKRLIDALAPLPTKDAADPADTRFLNDIAQPVASVLPIEIPLINSVAAGYPAEFTDLGYPARVADEYVRAPDVRDPDAFAARVIGDSMLPDYREGDIVIFSPARPVKDGMDCFARLEPDHETTFKRVYFEPGDRADSGARIRLQPLNPAFRARVLAREDVAGLYAAVSVMRML